MLPVAPISLIDHRQRSGTLTYGLAGSIIILTAKVRMTSF